METAKYLSSLRSFLHSLTSQKVSALPHKRTAYLHNTFLIINEYVKKKVKAETSLSWIWHHGLGLLRP